MKFKIYYENKSKINTIILDAYNIKDLNKNLNIPNNIISIRKVNTIDLNVFSKSKEKLELFYELKIMLNSNLLLEDIVDILLKGNLSKNNKDVLRSIKYALANGQELYKVLALHENYLGSNVILFFKIAAKNSNINTAMTSLYEIMFRNDLLKEKIKSSLTYPFILLASLFISIYIIFYFVLPRFEYIFEQFGDNLPLSTSILLNIKDFITGYYIFIFIFIIFLYLIFKILYSKFKIYFDSLFLKNIPVVSSVYKSILFYQLFLIINLIVKSKYSFYDALFNAKDSIKNDYLLSKLNYILKDLNKGIDIHQAFLNTKIFDNTTLRLLQTAQESNKFELILDDIVNIYDSKVNKSMNSFKIYLEPILIFFISIIVLWLVLAIMTPIWDLSSHLK